MKNKNTIITIIVLALVWFLGQHFFANKKAEITQLNGNDTMVAEHVSLEDMTYETDVEIEVDDSVDAVTLDLATLDNEEDVLNQELDDLDSYSF